MERENRKPSECECDGLPQTTSGSTSHKKHADSNSNKWSN